MNHYEAKQEARRKRLEARAERLQEKAASAFKRADLSEAATGIPFGQPILVGHHSEGKHRRTIARANAALSKGIELSKAAHEVAGRAASVGDGGISSDDPDAIAKLKERLAELEAEHAERKVFNKRRRVEGKEGVPAWDLSNRSANIRRIKERIAHLERIAAQRAPLIESGQLEIRREVNGVEIVENLEANRLQLIFPGKPSAEVRAKLKANGFRWAPSEGAWQRQLSNGAEWAAERVVA